MTDKKREEEKCVIIAAGDFSRQDMDSIPGFRINKGDLLIACDAGMKYLRELNLVPDLCIGDFDSAQKEDDLIPYILQFENDYPGRVIRLPIEKDDTDLMYAVKLAVKKGYRTFYLFGAMGGSRFSLSMASIQALVYLRHHDAEGVITSDGGKLSVFVLEDESVTFPSDAKGNLSLFVLSKRVTGLNLKNLKYELQDGILTNDDPMGVSNEFIAGKSAEISLRTGTLLVVAETE